MSILWERHSRCKSSGGEAVMPLIRPKRPGLEGAATLSATPPTTIGVNAGSCGPGRSGSPESRPGAAGSHRLGQATATACPPDSRAQAPGPSDFSPEGHEPRAGEAAIQARRPSSSGDGGSRPLGHSAAIAQDGYTDYAKAAVVTRVPTSSAGVGVDGDTPQWVRKSGSDLPKIGTAGKPGWRPEKQQPNKRSGGIAKSDQLQRIPQVDFPGECPGPSFESHPASLAGSTPARQQKTPGPRPPLQEPLSGRGRIPGFTACGCGYMHECDEDGVPQVGCWYQRQRRLRRGLLCGLPLAVIGWTALVWVVVGWLR